MIVTCLLAGFAIQARWLGRDRRRGEEAAGLTGPGRAHPRLSGPSGSDRLMSIANPDGSADPAAWRSRRRSLRGSASATADDAPAAREPDPALARRAAGRRQGRPGPRPTLTALPAPAREGHRRGRGDLPGRRLRRPRRPRGPADRRVAQRPGRRRGRPQVPARPRLAPPGDAPGRRPGDPDGPGQRRGLEGRPEAGRRPRLLGRRPPGLDHRHPLRRRATPTPPTRSSGSAPGPTGRS